jgi:predicted enzyme related to lactoylglutathione lyase
VAIYDRAVAAGPPTPPARPAGPGQQQLFGWRWRRLNVVDAKPTLIEFPADDPERARRFWSSVLGQTLDHRGAGEGSGWQTHGGADKPAVGVHERGRGPGDTFSLPYFTVGDIAATLERVLELGGTVVHPGEQWAICRDSEGSPFGLAAAPSTLT